MENDSKDLIIEQLQAQLKQLKQVADSGLSINNSEDLPGIFLLSFTVSLYCLLLVSEIG